LSIEGGNDASEAGRIKKYLRAGIGCPAGARSGMRKKNRKRASCR